MIRMGLILGFIMSLALIFAAYTETQGASVAEAQASVAPIQGCVTREVALDQGYGVTRTETRAVCAESSAAAMNQTGSTKYIRMVTDGSDNIAAP